MAYSISTALAIYFVLWWVVLFVTLPFGVRSQHEDGEGAPGTDPGEVLVTSTCEGSSRAFLRKRTERFCRGRGGC